MQPPSPNALDLPEILSVVVSLLPRNDLAHGCRVNRAWFLACAPLLWRRIQSDQIRSKEDLYALPRYAHHVRELSCFSLATGLCHDPSVLTQLTTLSTPVVTHRSIDAVLSLLQLNPALQSLSINLNKVDLTERVFRAIASQAQLRHLDFFAYWIPPGAMAFLIDSLPALKHLRLLQRATVFYGRDNNLSFLPTSPSSPLAGRAVCGLEDLETSSCTFWSQKLDKIIKSSPDLERLHLIDDNTCRNDTLSQGLERIALIVRDVCPKLKDWKIQSRWVNENNLRYLLTLSRIPLTSAQTPPPTASTTTAATSATELSPTRPLSRSQYLGLRSLSIFNESVEIASVLQIVLLAEDVLSHAMEELLVVDRRLPSIMGSTSLARILHTFTKLRLLCVDGARLHVDHLFEEGGQDLEVKEQEWPRFRTWACKDLQRLDVCFVHDDHDWCRPEAISEAKEDSALIELTTIPYNDTMDKTYPIYDGLKSLLDRLPLLDQRHLQFASVLLPLSPR
jgi:hypothetical protein